jgi:K+ transporter
MLNAASPSLLAFSAHSHRICCAGQASWMIRNPDGYATSFFSSIPWGNAFFYTYFVIAILAASVASQTMMSAAFSIVKQSMSLNCFPRFAPAACQQETLYPLAVSSLLFIRFFDYFSIIFLFFVIVLLIFVRFFNRLWILYGFLGFV